MKKFVLLVRMYFELIQRQNDLWKYSDWTKTHKMSDKFHETLNSFLPVRISKKVAKLIF